MVGTGNIRHWLVWLVCMALLSCGRDSDPVAPNDLPGVPEGVTVGFRISLGSMGGTRAVQDGYDDGTGTDYENHIDFPNLDYRFLFFDMQNRYIASFVPTGIKPSNPGTVRSKTYEVTGKIEQALPEDFKVVALANWTSYPDAPVAGATTLEEICTSVGSRYEYTPPFRLGERLIPMYGVRRCEGVTFTQNMHTDLGTIHMLRAMAKIEVVCRTAGWTLDRVVMHRYNARGFCAPNAVSSRRTTSRRIIRMRCIWWTAATTPISKRSHSRRRTTDASSPMCPSTGTSKRARRAPPPQMSPGCRCDSGRAAKRSIRSNSSITKLRRPEARRETRSTSAATIITASRSRKPPNRRSPWRSFPTNRWSWSPDSAFRPNRKPSNEP